MSLNSVRTWVCFCGVLVPTALLAAPVQDSGKGQEATAVEKVRKSLQEPVTIEIKDKTLEQAVTELKEKTKINLVLDRAALAATDPNLQMMWQQFAPPGGAPAPGAQAATISVDAKEMKVRDVLKKILAGENLTYVVIGDNVVITTEALGLQRQLKQSVSVDLDAVPFNQAIKQLARETGTNLLVDVKLKKEAEAAVTLHMDEVPLDTAVRLIAEGAGLRPVRLGNVIYLTTKENAKELRAEPELLTPGAPNPQLEYQQKLLQQMGFGNGIAIPGIAPAQPALPPAPPPIEEEKKEQKEER